MTRLCRRGGEMTERRRDGLFVDRIDGGDRYYRYAAQHRSADGAADAIVGAECGVQEQPQADCGCLAES